MYTILLNLLIFLVISGVIWKLCFVKNNDKEPLDIPGWIPIFGHGLKLVRGDLYTNICGVSEDCLKKDGLATIRICFQKWYIITDPEAFLMLSNTCLDKHYVYNFTKPVLGDGLITADESTWKIHRKLLNPILSISIINGLLNKFNTQATKLVELFSLQLNKPYDHLITIKAWNLETICLTTTGLQCDKNKDLRDKYLNLTDKCLHAFGKRLKSFWLHNDYIYNMSNLKKEFNVLTKEMTAFSRSIVKDKKDEIKNTKGKTGKFKTFLELIMDINNEKVFFTDEQIREETDTIIGAGFDTTATTLNILFIVLGSYPDVQQKVYEEIVQVLQESDRDLDKDDLPKFIFTEAVLKETMRLYPVVPVIGRKINKDIKYQNYTLKKNTTCVLSIYGLNRNSNWGPDANQFRPERWLDAATLPDHNNFGTFAIGKRNCIGKAYVMTFMKLIMVHVIRRYQITADINQLVFDWAFTLFPASGHQFTLKQRNAKSTSL